LNIDFSCSINYWQRIAILIGLLVAGLLGLFIIDPVPQDPSYHLFADGRSLFGIPNFNDVISNAGFLIVGFIGLFIITGTKRHDIFVQSPDAWPYLVFFTGVALIGVGSAYYHLSPSNDRLFWDRIPMAVAIMAFCSALIADRIHNKAGNSWLLLLLVALGILSLVYWRVTESHGHGDLRFYGFVQFYPVILLPVVLWLFPDYRYTSIRFIGWMIAWYALSKVMEYYDNEVFELLGHTISGHTLKHIASASSTFIVLRMLLVRHDHA
jgi:hypothetical protein